MNHKRIYIIGTSGSGKTFLAKKLSKKFGIPHYDLDDLIWKIKYTKKWSRNKNRKDLKKIANNKKWIIEGVSSSWVNYALRKSDIILVLSLSKFLVVKRLVVRFLRRKLTTKEKETFSDLIGLIKFSLKYKPQKQLMLIRHEGKEHLFLRNKEDIEKFISK